MCIMAAGMHLPIVFSGKVIACLFINGKCINVGTKHDGFALLWAFNPRYDACVFFRINYIRNAQFIQLAG